MSEVIARQGWRIGERMTADEKLTSASVVEMWEQGDAIKVGVGSSSLSLSVTGARKLARLLLDLALRVEKRNKEAAKVAPKPVVKP